MLEPSRRVHEGQESPAGSAATGQSRSRELDGLRGIAIALVVSLHSVSEFAVRAASRLGVPFLGDTVSVTTYSGLELFFVLSGTLMLGPYVSDHRPFKGWQYLRRRVGRIWPTYVAALLFAGLVIWTARSSLTWYSRQVLPPFSYRGWAAQLGVVNLGWTSYNGAWWSLTLEIAFYAVVPAVALLALNSRRRRSGWARGVGLAGVVGLTAASYLWATTPPRISPMGLVQLAFQFLPCFVWGALVARKQIAPRAGWLLASAGAALVALAIAQPALNVHAAFALFWSGVVVLATRGHSRIRAWLAEPHLVWLGERSYSLFLVHFSVFYLVDYALSRQFVARTTAFDVLSRLIGIPLAMLAAMVLFWLVERRAARGLETGGAFWPWDVKTGVAGSPEPVGPPGRAGRAQPGSPAAGL